MVNNIAVSTSVPSFSLRRQDGVGITLRTLSVLTGLAAGLALFLGSGFFFAFTTCEQSYVSDASSAWLCNGGHGLMTALMGVCLVVGPLASLAGGIAAAVRGEGRWLAFGLAAAAVCVPLVMLVSDARVSAGFFS